MSQPKTRSESTAVPRPKLPKGWGWHGGTGGLTLFGTNYDMGGPLAGTHGLGGYCGRLDSDGSGMYWINIEPITSLKGPTGDRHRQYGWKVVSRSFRAEEEALNAVPQVIHELYDEHA